MKTESNTGFHQEDSLGSIMNRHTVSLQSAAIDSSSEIISMGGYLTQPVPPMILAGNSCVITSSPALIQPGNSSVITSSPALIQPGNSSVITSSPALIQPGNSNVITSSPALIQPGNSSGSSLLFDPVSGHKHDAEFSVEWSVEEQYMLEDCLERYKDVPNILKYIKIAASLPDKTVRDVALRCRWMQRKRRKPEELNVGKKVNNRKGKQVESSSKVNVSSAPPQNMATYPLMMQHLDQNGRMSSEGISGTIMHRLKQNSQAFSQITSNLSAYKLLDNIDLFCHARNNITAILNDMRDMPGLMSQMLPLPVSIDEDLANCILPGATQSITFSSPSGIHLKPEPGCL